jgi:ATP-dependent RNA helicase RhlE
MKSFSELTLSAPLKNNLAKLGFAEPTSVQALAIEPALAGKNVVVTAPTGTGKTLAFVLPLIQRLGTQPAHAGIRSLILSPTRELAIQIHEVFAKMAVGTGLRSTVAVGGLNERTQLDSIRKGAQVLIATPGRLCDFLERKLVNLSGVQILILDEADRMLDMGFLPAIRRIVGVLPRERQTLCFSATMEGSMAQLVRDYTKNPVRLTFGSTSKPSESVRLQAFEVSENGKPDMLYNLLDNESGRCLIFSRTKRGTERIAKSLNRQGINAAMIHGDRSQSQRTAALTGFQRGQYRVLVATDVAARGIHVQDIAHVINYDLPDVAENFIHRVGRTGRAGERGVASTLFLREQRTDLFQLERQLGIKIERISANGQAAPKKDRTPSDSDRVSTPSDRVYVNHGRSSFPSDRASSTPGPRMTRLPGEILQAQMES